LVVKEVVADQLLLVVDVLGLPVRQDHVVQALEGGPRDLGVLLDDAEVILERAFPVLLLVALLVLHRRDASDEALHLVGFLHELGSFDWRNGAPNVGTGSRRGNPMPNRANARSRGSFRGARRASRGAVSARLRSA